MPVVRDRRWLDLRLESLIREATAAKESAQRGNWGLLCVEMRMVSADARAIVRAIEDGAIDE